MLLVHIMLISVRILYKEEKVIAKLTTTELPCNSLSGHPITSVFLFLKAALLWKGPGEEYSTVGRSQS